MDPGRYLGMVLRTGLEWSCGLMHRCLRMGESDAPAASCDFASMLVPILVFPHTKLLYLAIDLVFRPLDPDDLTSPRERRFILPSSPSIYKGTKKSQKRAAFSRKCCKACTTRTATPRIFACR